MLEVLQFVLSDPWRFTGTLALMLTAGLSLGIVIPRVEINKK